MTFSYMGAKTSKAEQEKGGNLWGSNPKKGRNLWQPMQWAGR